MTVVTDHGEEGTAITYDASATGLLMACPGSLPVDAHVTLRFKISADDPEERAVAARVLRVEHSPGEESPWRYRMAVEFDAPQPELEGLLEANRED